jgi:hypothetical protein
VSDGEEDKWERPSPAVPMRGIRPASPRGTTATGGVRSPLHHHLWCHACMREQPVRLVKRCLRLISGPRLHFVISMIFNHPNFEIENGDLPDVPNLPNFTGR